MHRDVAVAAGGRMHARRVVATDGHGKLSRMEGFAEQIEGTRGRSLSLGTATNVRPPLSPGMEVKSCSGRPLACPRSTRGQASGRALSRGPRDRGPRSTEPCYSQVSAHKG